MHTQCYKNTTTSLYCINFIINHSLFAFGLTKQQDRRQVGN